MSDCRRKPTRNTFKSLKTRRKSFSGITSMNSRGSKNDLLQAYLRDVESHPILSQEEILEAFRNYREEGDEKAKESIIQSTLRLVVRMAIDCYRGKGHLSLMDLIQSGNEGLIQAVKKYDTERKVKFSYYASFWIKSYIFKHISDNWRLVKVKKDQDKRSLFYKIGPEKNRLIKLGIEPSAEIIAENLGVDVEKVREMEEILVSELSLDVPISRNSDSSWIEFLASDLDIEEVVLNNDLREKGVAMLDRFRETLSEREITIFDYRICCDERLTLRELGEKLRLSREMIRKLEEGIYKKLYRLRKEEDPLLFSQAEEEVDEKEGVF